MLLDEKPLDSLEASDIEKLISEGICESQRVEYKLEWWGPNDESRREMLRDIASFANAYGGYLILGIKAQRNEGSGDLECPAGIVGLPQSNYREMILRSCRDNLDPICPGIEAKQIEVAGNSTVVVIQIPQSLNAPHMVTFKGVNQFWRRHGTDKQPMTTDEVRSMILGRVGSEERLTELIKQREGEILKQNANTPILWVWTSPLTALLEEVDVKDRYLRNLIGRSTEDDPFGFNCALHCGRANATLRGMRAQEITGRGTDFFRTQAIELHRNGYLDFFTNRFVNSRPELGCEKPRRLIIAPRVAIYIENFVSVAVQVFKHLHTQGPIAFGCKLLWVSGHHLYKSDGMWSDSREAESRWGARDIDLADVVTHDLESERVNITKKFNDLLWNAFQIDECPFYQTGEFVPPTR